MTHHDKVARSQSDGEAGDFDKARADACDHLTAGEGADLIRRRVLQTLAGGASLAMANGAAAEDQPWWQQVLQKKQRARKRSQPAKKSGEPKLNSLDDLRHGKTPWRSDVMLESIDKAIARYEATAAKQKWPKIPGGRLLRGGDYDERVPLIRKRLYLSGELPEKGYRYRESDLTYDDWLLFAVRKFQKALGLRDSGLINRSTLAQLNVSPEQRVAQLRLNRQRIANLIKTRVEDRYILVNAAAFQLEAVEKYEVAQRHRVIVGKPDRQTPEISALVKGLNFFPHWRVPMSVAIKDLFPRLVKDLSYLEEHHIRVVQGYYDGPEIDPKTVDWRTADARKIKFKQDPGEWNALGLVRIDMPNPDIVYMHDTPLKELFRARERAFSAGCVRVEDVMRLVSWIAKYEPGFDQASERVDEIISLGDPFDVKLTRPVPVYFTYISAWAERDGTVYFRPDIYGRDGSSDLRGESDPEAPKPPVMLSP